MMPGPPQVFSDPDALVGAFVERDAHVHLAATLSRPNALSNALARRFRGTKSLTISTTAMHSSAHALTIAQAVRKVITGFVGDTYPTPRPNPLYRSLGSGEPFEVEMWSLLTYTPRLMAAAQGQPYATTGSRILESDLSAARTDAVSSVRHDDGTDITVMTPLIPDWTLVHGACADRAGNIVITAPVGEGAWAGYAARRGVLASVERIVDDARSLPADKVMIPGQLVRGICVAEYGAHPQSLRTDDVAGVPGYLDDYEFMIGIVEACASEEGRKEWFDHWIDVSGHAEYVARLQVDGSPARIAMDRPAPKLAVPEAGIPPTVQEQLIVLSARAVMALVQDGGYNTLLAGIGTSHISAWLAQEMLRRDGIEIGVMAELGFGAMRPVAGDVFLFSQRHADQSAMLTGIPQILGGMVAANDRCLGVLSAAEVDTTGTINTTQLPDGRWITGSGGANDIASTTRCVVIAPASRRRYVREVAHRTSPGHNVLDVVSQFGRFSRSSADSDFELLTWLQPPGMDAVTPQQAIERLTSWVAGGDAVSQEKAPTEEELAALRRIDPEGHYR